MHPAAAPPPVRCREAGAVALAVASTLLHELARDGQVAMSDVEKVFALVGKGTVHLDQAYAAQEKRCAEARQKKGTVGSRSDPMRRLLVRPFEWMLTEDPSPFERRYLPSYFAAAETLLGSETWAELDKQCKDAVNAMLAVHGGNLDWDTFFSDGRVVAIIHLAVKRLAARAKDPLAWRRALVAASRGENGTVPPDQQIANLRDIIVSVAAGLGGEPVSAGPQPPRA